MPKGIYKHHPQQGFQKGNKPKCPFQKDNKIGPRFKKGHTTWNKGLKGYTHKGSFKKGESRFPEYQFKKGIHSATEFKKGQNVGSKNVNWNKSGKLIHSAGYVLIRQPNHPFCDCRGYILKHRFIIEQQIGRYLKPEEASHHLGKRNDNRSHMLMAFVNQSAHIRFHSNPNNVKPSEIIFDGRKEIYEKVKRNN